MLQVHHYPPMSSRGQEYHPTPISSLLTKAHSETRLLTSPIPPRHLDSTPVYSTTTSGGGGRVDPQVGPEPLLQRSLLVGSSWSSRSSQTLKSVDGDQGLEKNSGTRQGDHSGMRGMKTREGSTEGPTPAQVTVRHAFSNELPTSRTHGPLTESLSLEDQALLFQDPGSCDRCRVLNKVFHDLSRRHTAVRQALQYERELNAELSAHLAVVQESGSSVQSVTSETKMLRAHMDLLQNKVQALQEENAQLITANGRLEEDREELRDLVRKAYDRHPPATGEDTSSERSNMAAPTRSLEEFSTLAFRDSVYTTSSASTMSPNRGSGISDSTYPGEQVGVYSYSYRAPIWSGTVLPHLGGMAPPSTRHASLPVSCTVEEQEGMREAEAIMALTLGQTEDDIAVDRLSRGASKPASTTMIGGSGTNYTNIQLWSPQSASPSPELGSRSSAVRKTLPVNYGSRRRSSEFKRSRSYRDPHRMKRGSSDPFHEAASRKSTPDTLTNSPATKGGGQGRGGAKGQRKHNNGKSILLCFSRPHTTD